MLHIYIYEFFHFLFWISTIYVNIVHVNWKFRIAFVLTLQILEVFDQFTSPSKFLLRWPVSSNFVTSRQNAVLIDQA